MKGFLPAILKIRRIYNRYSIPILLLPIVILVLVSVSILLRDVSVKAAVKNYSVIPAPEFVSEYTPVSLPVAQSFSDIADASVSSSITARSAIVLDNDSQTLLFEKNAYRQYSLASTTKIMTAYTALNHFKLDDVLTVQSEGIDGVVLGLQKGEKLTFHDLLYGMLLPSGNDAAVAIADNYPGGRDAFIEAMNENARKLHLYNTHFSDPSGLNDQGDYTTALDLARLTSVMMRNSIFASIVGTKQAVLNSLNFPKIYPVFNRNILLGLYGVNGVKTGTTEEAGEVLVTSRVEDGRTYIIIVMGSTDRFADTQTLINDLAGKVTFKTF